MSVGSRRLPVGICREEKGVHMKAFSRAIVLGIGFLMVSGSPAHAQFGDMGDVVNNDAGDALPAWITHPEELPPGLMGRNNCTFLFGQAAQWDFHPDGACWERPGPDGWTRQQQHRVHVWQLAACGNGPGDVSPVRVCRAPGEPNPCHINALTGPTGCALCVRSVECH